MKSGVYAIVCLVTGQRYVGGSTNIGLRWKRHISELHRGKHSNAFLQAAWTKYGAAQFSFTILELGTDIRRLEQKWINERCEFNVFRQANRAGPIAHSDETKAKMRGARPLMANNQNAKGAKRSQETRAKMAAAKKGVPSKLRGRTLSGEHKAKISATKRLLAGSDHVDCDCTSCRPP